MSQIFFTTESIQNEGNIGRDNINDTVRTIDSWIMHCLLCETLWSCENTQHCQQVWNKRLSGDAAILANKIYKYNFLYILHRCFHFNSISFWQHLSTFEASFFISLRHFKRLGGVPDAPLHPCSMRLHPLLAPICRPAWTPVGTGRFPLQDMGSLFSNCLPFERNKGLTSSLSNTLSNTYSETESGSCWPERICETFPNTDDNPGSV